MPANEWPSKTDVQGDVVHVPAGVHQPFDVANRAPYRDRGGVGEGGEGGGGWGVRTPCVRMCIYEYARECL